MVVFRSREKAEFDEHWAKILTDDACLKKTIVADGKVAGHIGSFGRDGKREVGYWIDRTLWGRGIMSQALAAFLRFEQQPAALRRRCPTQHCVDARPAKMWLHLMPERDRSGTRARRRVAYPSQAYSGKRKLRVESRKKIINPINTQPTTLNLFGCHSRVLANLFRGLRDQHFRFQTFSFFPNMTCQRI